MEFANQRATPASAQARLFGSCSEGASMGLNGVQPTVFQLLCFMLPPCSAIRACPPFSLTPPPTRGSVRETSGCGIMPHELRIRFCAHPCHLLKFSTLFSGRLRY